MTRFRNILIVLLGLLAVVAGVVGVLLLIEGLEMARDFHKEGLLTLEHVNRELIVIGGLTANVEKSSRAVEAAAQEQRTYWREISKQTNTDLAELNHTIVALGRTADAASASLAGIQRDIGDITIQSVSSIRAIGNTASALQPGIQALTETAQNSARITGSPFITSTLTNLAETSQHTAAIAANVEATSADIKEAVHRSTRPASWTVRIGTFLLEKTVQAAQIAAGFFK